MSQAIDLGFEEFVFFVIDNDRKLPSSILIKLLQYEHINVIKEILIKQISVYDIETDTCTLFLKTTNSLNTFFRRLDEISDITKVKEKNSIILPKHIIYYLYKSSYISKEKRDNIIKELTGVMNMSDNEMLTSIIKMKDQDLAEYVYK